MKSLRKGTAFVWMTSCFYFMRTRGMRFKLPRFSRACYVISTLYVQHKCFSITRFMIRTTFVRTSRFRFGKKLKKDESKSYFNVKNQFWLWWFMLLLILDILLHLNFILWNEEYYSIWGLSTNWLWRMIRSPWYNSVIDWSILAHPYCWKYRFDLTSI